jgi:hypothetical protein
MYINIPAAPGAFTDLSIECETSQYIQMTDGKTDKANTAPSALLAVTCWKQVSLFATSSNIALG